MLSLQGAKKQQRALAVALPFTATWALCCAFLRVGHCACLPWPAVWSIWLQAPATVNLMQQASLSTHPVVGRVG